MSVAIVVGSNRFIDCQNVIVAGGAPVLRVAAPPLQISLGMPPRTPIQFFVVDNREEQLPDSNSAGRLAIVAEREAFDAFWEKKRILGARLIEEAGTFIIHLHLDLRPVGINIYNDLDTLFVGSIRLSGNVFERASAGIVLD